MATAINELTILLVTLGFLATLVSAETYYIVPSDDNITCPPSETTPTGNMSFPVTPTDHTPLDENASCLTLSQFAWWHWSEPVSPDTNITLIFVPGHHTLDSRLQIRNVTNLVSRVVQTNDSSPTSVAMVTCTNSAGFNFEDISEVSVSGLVFNDCRRNTVRSVDELRMEHCRFENGHGMELMNVSNATFERNSFISLTAFAHVGTDNFEPYSKFGGGAIFAFDSGLLVRECLFEFNRASAGLSAFRGDGGAIWANSSSVSISSSSFHNNTAGVFGGAIYIAFDASVSIQGSNFNRNTAAGDFGSGGAIYSEFNANVSIQGSNFSRNTAAGDFGRGGAIYSEFNANVSIQGSNFSRNTAAGDFGWGGAIYSEFNANVSIQGSNFSRNTAFFGGAIAMLFGNNIINIHDSNFCNNTASSGGAVLTFGDNMISIYGSSFTSNSADVDGGALLLHGTSDATNIHDSYFSSNSAGTDGGALVTSRGTTNIRGSHFSSNLAGTDGGALVTSRGTTNIRGSHFSSNLAGIDGGALFLGSFSGSVNEINNSVFNHNHAANRGGAIYVQSTTLSFNGFLQITNNSATTGVVFALHSTLSISGDTIISDNKASFYAFGSNVTLSGLTNFTNNSHIHDTNVEEGGAITAFQSDIILTGTVNIMYNAIYNYYGGAILSSESKIYTYGDTTIAHNTALSGGGIHVYQSELNFEGITRIEENVGEENGGGIYAVGSTIKLSQTRSMGQNLNRVDRLEFIGNRAENGGGIYLELNAKLYLIKSVPECFNFVQECYWSFQSSLRLHFTNNLAEYGGALYISDDTCSANTVSSTSSECFFQDLALHTESNQSLIVQDTFFDGNSANISGGTLFGGLLDRCTVSPYAQVINKYHQSENTTTLDAISYLTKITNIQANDTQLEISSKPVRVCLCRNSLSDCDNSPPALKVKKGETFNISLVAVDQVRNPIPSSVRAFLSSNLGGLAEGQNAQKTTSNCTELNFTINSPRDHSEQLVLYADGPCSDLGISQTRVNVTFLPCDCPIGFIRTAQQSTCNCECDPCLSPDYVTDCSPANSSVQRRDNIWIHYINETVDDVGDYQNECQYLTYPHCPFDYCHPSSSPVWINLNTPTGSDAQCAFNRTGKLCGSCKNSLSLSLGSSLCMQCSANYWLALLIVFAIAGVTLVAFLLVFNLTVTVGTINGLIFYANILTTNRSTFFPFQTPNFFTIFIAWLNLDFGFVTCFFGGMDGYAKEWLQLAFPIYIIFLVTMVIIACEYSTRIARLFTHTNPVATLATLILLSYAKSLRVIIAALSQATLEYPDGSRERVWLIDANIQYFEGKHIPLFLVALLILLVGIVYTSLLFSYQWLQRCSNRIALKWIKNARFYPFMDAYLAPYNLKHRYWTGLLLLIRAFLYVIAAFNVSGDPGNNLLSIICTLICVLVLKESLIGRVYKSWPLNALENSFILNLLLFSVGSLYILQAGVGNQEALAYTSTSIAFITFLAILIYHTYAFILPKKAQNKLDSFKPSRLFTKEENTDHEIIHSPKNVVTYSVVDGIPPDPRLAMEEMIAARHEREAALAKLSNETDATKIDPSYPSDSSVPSKQLTKEDSTPTSEQIAAKPHEKVIIDGMSDKKIGQEMKGTVNIELEPRPTKFSDIRLDPYIRDSDELGMERESEIQDFLETTQ